MNDEEVRRLYVDEGLTLAVVAERLGCSLTTAWRHLMASGVTCREAAPRHLRTTFGGSLAEQAYLVGLRIGDLHVAMEGSRTIVVKCTSTRAEQIDLFRLVFGPYGHVYTDEAGLSGRKRQSIGMEVRLDMSFAFLLPKQDAVPDWILASDETFFAFFGGYVDAEGYFHKYYLRKQPKPLARLEIRSYDSTLLTQLGEGLNARGILCAPARLRVRAGYTNKYGVRSNRDLWGLGVHRRDSLRALIARLDAYIRHARRRRDMLAVLEVAMLA
jgi:hypothetical protein